MRNGQLQYDRLTDSELVDVFNSLTDGPPIKRFRSRKALVQKCLDLRDEKPLDYLSTLSVEQFGWHLLESNDLDPIYLALVKMKMDPVQLNRWLFVYWCCYDAGVSSFIAESDNVITFWARMRHMAENELPAPIGGRWRRAAERRHWRGKNALASLNHLRDRYEDRPEDMASYCAHGEIAGQAVLATQTTCSKVMTRAQTHLGFGPWIAFKIADMAERVMGVSVSFEEAEVFMFDAPVEAALMVWDVHEQKRIDANPGVRFSQLDKKRRISDTVTRLTHVFSDIKAPPGWDRPVGIQEVETVLCKWKSHVNGHYPLFHDQREIIHHLQPWVSICPLAARFLEAMPGLPTEEDS